jgi:hypothetical protein
MFISFSQLTYGNTDLPSHIPRDDIVEYLERFGTLTEFKQIGGGVSGFAQYKSAQDAKVVLDRFQNQLFLGHRAHPSTALFFFALS